jgi:hypothetical protein
VDNWPSSIKGLSTCLAPNIIKIIKLVTNIQKAILLSGLKARPLSLPRSVTVKTNMTSRALNIAMTPNNLLGIERRIA